MSYMKPLGKVLAKNFWPSRVRSQATDEHYEDNNYNDSDEQSKALFLVPFELLFSRAKVVAAILRLQPLVDQNRLLVELKTNGVTFVD